jgi:hypothetical protein
VAEAQHINALKQLPEGRQVELLLDAGLVVVESLRGEEEGGEAGGRQQSA